MPRASKGFARSEIAASKPLVTSQNAGSPSARLCQQMRRFPPISSPRFQLRGGINGVRIGRRQSASQLSRQPEIFIEYSQLAQLLLLAVEELPEMVIGIGDDLFRLVHILIVIGDLVSEILEIVP